MLGTVESTHRKFFQKINTIKQCIDDFQKIMDCVLQKSTGEKSNKPLERIDTAAMVRAINAIEHDYCLSTVNSLNDYYTAPERETDVTRDYYRVFAGENFIARFNELSQMLGNNAMLLQRIIGELGMKGMVGKIDAIIKCLNLINNISVDVTPERTNYKFCDCNAKMIAVAELSSMLCNNCGRTRKIEGTLFRDEQICTQDGQKSKNGGYIESRHFKFWIERIQARESKVFLPKDLDNIEKVIKRDGYEKKEITCTVMRTVLKDSEVAATSLNDHVPLLVKIFDGVPPPQLDHGEIRLSAIRFNKAMKLYEQVNPKGGNKPYYPYFIHKILEEMFKNNPEKIRILQYIHLQSRETIIKNDKHYEQMCAISDDPGLKYTPTDPSGRI